MHALLLRALLGILGTAAYLRGNAFTPADAGSAAQYFRAKHPMQYSAVPKPPPAIYMVDSADRFQLWWDKLDNKLKKSHYLRGQGQVPKNQTYK
jgi:hypothetical protein